MTDSYYFFLSFAHSPPLPRRTPTDLDVWVHRLFEDLSTAVTRHASTAEASGFADHLVPPDADRKAARRRALGGAETFVPLCSPPYFARARTGTEWEWFRRRMASSAVAQSHIIPVLWTPMPSESDADWLREALSLPGLPASYPDNGLQVLARLTVYRDDYLTVVDQLARRIVHLAEQDPLPSAEADDLDQIASPFKPVLPIFAVTVAAPRGLEWHPFPEDPKPTAAQYAQDVAEQLDFAVDARSMMDADDPAGRPGVLLIDPLLVEDATGAEELRGFARALEPWVVPVTLGPTEADPRIATLGGKVGDILRQAGARQARHLGSLGEFIRSMPFLVAEAEAAYLKHGPLPRPVHEPATRPKLRPLHPREDPHG